MNRRGFLGAAVASVGLAGCNLTLRDGIYNACAGPLPAALRNDPLIDAAWQGLVPSRVVDSHFHLVGIGDTTGDVWIHPEMTNPGTRTLLQRHFYFNAACVGERTPADEAVVARLVEQCREMRRAFARCCSHSTGRATSAGRPIASARPFASPTTTPPAWPRAIRIIFQWAASIHPFDPTAVARLDHAAARGARAIKWLPSAQHIDPADPRCDAFYARLRFAEAAAHYARRRRAGGEQPSGGLRQSAAPAPAARCRRARGGCALCIAR